MMKALVELLDEHEESLRGVERLRIYIQDIEDNYSKRSDEVIGLCCSLIQSSCKNLLKNYPNPISEKEIEGLTFKKGVETTLKKAVNVDPLIDKDIILSVALAVQNMVTIRNKRDEGAHGHIFPLLESSHPRLEDFILRTTEAITIYLIEVTINSLSVELEKLEIEVEYEDPDNSQFNLEYDELIEINLTERGLSVSEVYHKETPSYALYVLDRDEYVQLLENWRDDQNLEDNE